MTAKKNEWGRRVVKLPDGRRIPVDVVHTWHVYPVGDHTDSSVRGHSNTTLTAALENFTAEWIETENLP